MRQAKILIEAERLRHPNSGIAQVSKALAKGLSEIGSDYLYTFYGPDVFKDLNAESLSWKNWHRWAPPKTFGYDLIHISHQLSHYFHGKARNVKKIVTVHDLNFLHDGSRARKRNKSIALVQKNIGEADGLVFISNFAKANFDANRHLFTLKKNVLEEVIHNGLIFPEPNEFDSQFSFLKDQKFILNIGVLFPKKNQKVLLPLLVGNDKKLVLIASDAKKDYYTAFMDQAIELGVASRVLILENVSNDEKNFLLQHCESLCHPSLAEGFGIPPVEAMYHGKPVFLRRLTSLPEIGGSEAFYFENFNPENMRSVYEEGMNDYNRNLQAKTERLRIHAQQFSYITMAKAYQDFYQKILEA